MWNINEKKRLSNDMNGSIISILGRRFLRIFIILGRLKNDFRSSFGNEIPDKSDDCGHIKDIHKVGVNIMNIMRHSKHKSNKSGDSQNIPTQPITPHLSTPYFPPP